MKKLSPVMSSLVMILAGILLFIYAGTSLEIGVRLLGIAMLLYGALGLVAQMMRNLAERSVAAMVYDAVIIVFGIAIIASPSFIIRLFPIVAGVLIAISGVETLVKSLSLRKHGIEAWKMLLILSVITIAFGILIFANPFQTQELLVRVFACGLVYDGIVLFIASAKSR